MCIRSGKEIFDLSNNFSQFCISSFVVEGEKPTHTKIRVNLDFVPTNLTTLYSYLIGIPWLLILRMIQTSYFLPFTIKLIRLLKRICHWHHKHVIFNTLEPRSAVYKSWVEGEMYCSFSTHWLISIYELFPAPNIHTFIPQLVRVLHQYTRSRVQTLLKSWLFQASIYSTASIAFITARIIAYLISHPQFNIWNTSYITSTFLPLRLLKTQKKPAPHASGFIGQLVKASHRYWSCVQTLLKSRLFAGFYIRKSINCFHNCDDHCLLDFTSTVQYLKYFKYNFKLIPHGLLRTPKWPAPNISSSVDWIIAQVSWGHRFKHRQSADFFRLLYTQLHKLLLYRDWFISIYDLFPAPNIHAFMAQLLRISHQYTRSWVQTLLKSWLFQASLHSIA